MKIFLIESLVYMSEGGKKSTYLVTFCFVGSAFTFLVTSAVGNALRLLSLQASNVCCGSRKAVMPDVNLYGQLEIDLGKIKYTSNTFRQFI